MSKRIHLSPDSEIDSKDLYQRYQKIADERAAPKYEPKNGGSSLAEFFKAMDNLARNQKFNGVLPLVKQRKAASK